MAKKAKALKKLSDYPDDATRDAAVEVELMLQQPQTPDHELLLQFFPYAHLREDLQTISKPFGDLATWVVGNLPRNPERTVALRKLLEAKDCAVRSRLWKA